MQPTLEIIARQAERKRERERARVTIAAATEGRRTKRVFVRSKERWLARFGCPNRDTVHFSWLLHRKPGRLCPVAWYRWQWREAGIEHLSTYSSVCFAFPRDLSSIVRTSDLAPPRDSLFMVSAWLIFPSSSYHPRYLWNCQAQTSLPGWHSICNAILQRDFHCEIPRRVDKQQRARKKIFLQKSTRVFGFIEAWSLE